MLHDHKCLEFTRLLELCNCHKKQDGFMELFGSSSKIMSQNKCANSYKNGSAKTESSFWYGHPSPCDLNPIEKLQGELKRRVQKTGLWST